MEHILTLQGQLPVIGESAGYCVTKGLGQHVTRVIDSYEIIYVRTGTLGMFEGDVRYEIKQGQAMILFPERLHGGTRTFDKDLTFYWAHFRIQKDMQGNALFSLPQVIHLTKQERFEELLRRYIKWNASYQEDKSKGNLMMFQLLMELQEYQLENKKTNAVGVLAAKARNYIGQHLEEELTTTIIANALGCNADYLGRVYMQAYNKTLTKGIQEQRMNLACRLLIETNCNINEIALQCGYEDTSQFRRIFKTFKGESPKEYRKKYCIVEE